MDVIAELLTATAVVGGIGYGLDRAFGTGPILMVIGAVAGHALGIYIIWQRPVWRAQEHKRRESQTK